MATPVWKATLTPDEQACSSQPHYMLAMCCKSTALARAVSAGTQESLEAWRSLAEAHEPSSLTRSVGPLQESFSASFSRATSPAAQRYRDVGGYETANGETFPPNIRIGAPGVASM